MCFLLFNDDLVSVYLTKNNKKKNEHKYCLNQYCTLNADNSNFCAIRIKNYANAHVHSNLCEYFSNIYHKSFSDEILKLCYSEFIQFFEYFVFFFLI